MYRIVERRIRVIVIENIEKTFPFLPKTKIYNGVLQEIELIFCNPLPRGSPASKERWDPSDVKDQFLPKPLKHHQELKENQEKMRSYWTERFEGCKWFPGRVENQMHQDPRYVFSFDNLYQ